MKKILLLTIIILNLFGDMVEYKSIKECSKPSGYISMNYSIDKNNSIGDSINILINLISDINTKIVSVDIQEDKELNIISIDKVYKELDNRDSYNINIITKSLVEGQFYITLNTTTSYKDIIRYKSFPIPINIGSKKDDNISKNSFIIYKGMESIGKL